MSDTQTQVVENPNEENLRRLREKAARTDTLEETNAVQARKIAFLQAGVDFTKGTGKLLFDSNQGEPSPEAIKALAEEYGITGGSQAAELVTEQHANTSPVQVVQTPTGLSAEERQAAERARETFKPGGPGATSTGTEHGIYDRLAAEFRGNMQRGMDRDAAYTEYLNSLMKHVAANPQDRTVVWQGGFTPEELETGKVPWQ